jgi:hypothetical protein
VVTRLAACFSNFFHQFILFGQIFSFVPIKCTGYKRELQDDLVAAVDKWRDEGRPGAPGNGTKKKRAKAKRESNSPSPSRLRSPSRVKSEPMSGDEDEDVFDLAISNAGIDWAYVPQQFTKSGRKVRQPDRM